MIVVSSKVPFIAHEIVGKYVFYPFHSEPDSAMIRSELLPISLIENTETFSEIMHRKSYAFQLQRIA